MPGPFASYVALGDSFTEGLGDPRPDGSLRGWSDRLARALAVRHRSAQSQASQQRAAQGEPVGNSRPFEYANLAVRGRTLGPILAEQLDAAIAMKPDLVSLNGGGNDMLRPHFDLAHSIADLEQATLRLTDAGIHVLLLAGPDPSRHLPFGKVFRTRGREFVAATAAWAPGRPGITYADNFNDSSLWTDENWSADGLHLAPSGHLKVALNCLRALQVPPLPTWDVDAITDWSERGFMRPAYYREHVVPWMTRRIKRISSGDHRRPKRPELGPLVS